MKPTRVTSLILMIGFSSLHAQMIEHKSIHEIQNASPPFQTGVISTAASVKKSSGVPLLKVYGYHPYWINSSAINSYQFDVLSHIAYFSYEVDPVTGGYKTIHDWLTTSLVDKAHAASVRVHLTVTNFSSSNNSTLLSNPIARDTLIANLVRLVQLRNAEGVNIDFESVPASQRANLVTFTRDLKTKLSSTMPVAEVSMASPAVDWNNSWDLPALAQYIDLFFVMCYDYYWSGSDYAGPVAPLAGINYNVTRTIDWYISQGIPPAKIIMGVPYYGYDWPVESSVKQAKTTGTGTPKTYSIAKQDAQKNGRQWHATFLSPWYSYNNGSSWQQCWYDDSISLRAKYELALQKKLCGVGMWALGYDNGNPELWNLLRTMFTTSTDVALDDFEKDLYLSQNYPNPFTQQTTINFEIGDVRFESPTIEGSLAHVTHLASASLRHTSHITFKVYDVLGREVLDLSDRVIGPPKVDWSLVIRNSDLPSPGIYFYRLMTPHSIQTKAMIMLER